MTNQTKLRHFLAMSTFLAALAMIAPALASAEPLSDSGRSLEPNTQFYIAKPNHGALEQIAALTSSGDKADAQLIGSMIKIPQAVWFTSGTPKGIKQAITNTVQR